jgi:LacI family transcriptional regulator
MKKVTIHEIARALEIDSSTVSRALNDSARVKKVTKDKILKKANELGYKRNMIASNLRKNVSNTIGVVLPRISRHFFSTAIAGIENVAQKHGFNVIISQSLEQFEKEELIINNLINNRVDGIIISVSMETTQGEHLKNSVASGIPVVFFDRHINNFLNTGKVLIDDELGGFLATNHLIKRGCKKIAHFSGPQDIAVYRNRLKGYKKALEKDDLVFDENYTFSSRLMELDGIQIAEKLLTELKDVDGAFFANDVAAIAAIKHLKKSGVNIPNDIAIIGFSNEPISEIIEPSLTTIDQSGEEIGRLACELLIKNIEKGNRVLNNETVILKPNLIERESTKRN